MMYLLLPIGLIAILAVVVLYFALIKKDMKKAKAILLPGLTFAGIWAVIYYFMLR